MLQGSPYVAPRRPGVSTDKRRRRRLLTRGAPIAAVAVGAFIAGILTATSPGRAERALVTGYVNAWARHDYARMYQDLDPASRRRFTEGTFAAAYDTAANTATMTALTRGRVGSRTGDLVPVAMRVRTRLFGTLRQTVYVSLSGSGSGARVHFVNSMVFPGLRTGELLTRHVRLAARGELLASDGTPLATGPGRTSPIPDVASEIVGTLGPIPAARATEFSTSGYPPEAKVGIDGLERIFEHELAGTPGGDLLAGRRVIAHSEPLAGLPVRTTINPTIERAAVTAMAGRYAGIAVMDPRTGGLLALAGVAFSALQPPGSTFKIITATGALEARIVKLSDTFPVLSGAPVGGVTISNANGESCGGTFVQSFANSCNSVFAPLGAKLGGARLVNIAERFGFNQPPSIPGAAESQIPSANTIGDALAVGSSAIGQGVVQTTALQMTDVAATIAMGGRRPVATLDAQAVPRFIRVTSTHIAHLVQRLMLAVVAYGTGTAAQIPGVRVAGKTGTAELRNTQGPGADPNGSSPSNTDAWFVGYAPVGAPRVVVGALFPEAGAGGATAAPAVHDVLVAALHAVH
ncbi:MAG: penicillin-binding transpeptidase domain-containing protein [Solirubrobacteraceae bacterium]